MLPWNTVNLLLIMLLLILAAACDQPPSRFQKSEKRRGRLRSRQIAPERDVSDPEDFYNNDDKHLEYFDSVFPIDTKPVEVEPKSIMYCTKLQENMILYSIDEAIRMLRRAAGRLQVLEGYLSNQEVAPIQYQDPTLASTFRTFSTLITRHLHTNGRLWGSRRGYTLDSVKSQIWIANTIANGLKTRKYQITCGDDWLYPVVQINPIGRLAFDSRPGLKTKYQPLYTIPAGMIMFSYPANQAPSLMEGYIFQWLDGPYPSVLILNPNQVNEWKLPFQLSDGRSLDHYENMRIGRYARAEWRLQELSTFRHLTSTLIHEFSHSWWMLGEEKALIDVNVTDYPEWSTLTPYSWDMAVRLADDLELAHEKIGLAGKNAENFMFLVIALYLDRYDWSLGFNRPLAEALYN